MKKLKMQGKLSLNKETVTQLNNEQMANVQGGGVTSIGRECTKINRTQCAGTKYTKGFGCNVK